MTDAILITGATGKLGRLVVSRLLEKGDRVRVFTRRPDEVTSLWGNRVDVVQGNFSDFAKLKEAARGSNSLFLLSPISENLLNHQSAVIDAARLSQVERIVKISGADWTIKNADRSVAGAAHAAVEAYLSTSGVKHTVIRPNAWMQVSLAPVIAAVKQGADLPSRYGTAAISFLDASDIADVAVSALTSKAVIAGPLVLTGGEALTELELASIAARILRRPVGLAETSSQPLPAHFSELERRAISEFIQLIGEGHASSVTDTVFRITGQQPRGVEAYLRSHLAVGERRVTGPKGEKVWH